MPSFRTLAQWLPPKARAAVYSVLGTLYLVEVVIDVINPDVERKVLGVCAVLGFGMAALNTPTRPGV